MIIIKLLLFLLGQYFSFVAIGGPRAFICPAIPRAIPIYLCMPHALKRVSLYIYIPSPQQLDYLVFRGCPQAQEVKRPQTALLIQT